MQTSYSDQAAPAIEGQPFDSSANIESYAAEGGISKGKLVQNGSAAGLVDYISAVSDDDDSILKSGGASAAAKWTESGAALNGDVYGAAAEIVPAQRVSITLNSHSDWDATWVQVVGEDRNGDSQDEWVQIPNGGNDVISTKKAFGKVTALNFDAQTGTNGTFTVGTLNDDEMVMDRKHFPGVAAYNAFKKPAEGTVISGVDADYDAGESVPVVTKGKVWVKVEAAVYDGYQAYARMTESGTDIRGQFRGTPATGFAKVPGAFFRSDAGVDELAVLEL